MGHSFIKLPEDTLKKAISPLENDETPWDLGIHPYMDRFLRTHSFGFWLDLVSILLLPTKTNTTLVSTNQPSTNPPALVPVKMAPEGIATMWGPQDS